MKEKLAIVIAALMITSMATAISTTTVSASPGATVSPTSARTNTRITFTVTVTNGYATDNIDNVIIKATTAFVQPISYAENLVLAADNMENSVAYIRQAGENMKLAEDNKKSAGLDIKSAADNLLGITVGSWQSAALAGSGVTAAGDNAFTRVRAAANNLVLVSDAIDNTVENLEYIYTYLTDAGTQLKYAAGRTTPTRDNIENFSDTAADNVKFAGDNLIGAAASLRNGDLETAGTWLDSAGRNLVDAGGILDDLDLALAVITTAGSNLRTAAAKLIDAGNFLDNAGYALDVAQDYLRNAGVRLATVSYLGTAGANLQIAADNIENAGTALYDNVLKAGNILKYASDNLENVAAEIGVALGKDEENAAAVDIDQAAENLRSSGKVDITTAGNELISAASNLSTGASTMKSTASALGPTTWSMSSGADYVLFNAIGDNVITTGSSKTFVFLWTTPTIATQANYTISVLVSKEEVTYTAYENYGGFTLTVDGRVPTLTINVTQVGVAENNLVGNKLDSARATITIVASEALQSIGTVYVENSGNQENLVPPITLTTTDHITYTGTFTVGTWDDNSCQVRVTSAEDLAGNENTAGMVRSFTVDTRAPLLDNGVQAIVSGMRENVSQAGTGTIFRYVDNTASKSVVVTVRDNVTAGTATENTRVTSVIIDTTAMARDPTAENRWTKTITLSGGYNSVVKVTATDWTGNSISDNVENIFIDTQVPTIAFNTIAGETWTDLIRINDNKPRIKLTVLDPGYPSGLGVAKDNLTVVLDNDDNIFNTLPAWGLTLDNAIPWVVANGIFENVLGGVDGLPENTYYINVRASDNLSHAGVDNVRSSRRFIIDVTAPSAPASVVGSVVAGTVAAPTTTRSSSVTITGTAEANSTVKVYTTTNAGVTWTEYAAGEATVSAIGAWTTSVDITDFAGEAVGIAVTTTDAAGNESTRQLYGYLIYDASAPVVAITSPVSNTSTDQASIQVAGTVTKDAWESYSGITLTLQIGVGSVSVPIGSDGSFVYSVALSEGSNTILARATDGVNTSDPVTVTVTRTVTQWATYAIIIVIIALILAAIAIFRRR